MSPSSRWSGYILVTLLVVAGVNCARAARDTTGFAIVDSAVVNAPFEEAWQATKSALRQMDLNIYTRDKRGAFVAYSEMQRQLRLFTPHRTQLTITLERVSGDTTRVTIETLDQVYGVTLLTYPDWHDRKAKDNALALSILESIQAHIAGTDLTPDQAEPASESAKPE